MDDRQFDVWTKASATQDRRIVARLVAAVALGFALGGPHLSAARKRKKRKKCKGGTKKCGKRCIPKAECCGGCASGKTCCSGTCTVLQADGANCGACGNVCASGSCSNGICACSKETDCPEGCGCFARIQGAPLCFRSEALTEQCDIDSDCDTPGDFCLAANRCGTLCTV